MTAAATPGGQNHSIWLSTVRSRTIAVALFTVPHTGCATAMSTAGPAEQKQALNVLRQQQQQQQQACQRNRQHNQAAATNGGNSDNNNQSL
jgi:hypothetical protein